MFDHIVVALDGGELSDKALDYALTIARTTRGKIRLVHVVDHRTTATVRRLMAPTEPKIIEQLSASGREVLEAGKERCTRWDVPVSVFGTEGVVAHEICTAAKEFSADLIVMGTHNRTGAAGVLLGSVAQGVLAESPCPVFLVR